MKPLLLLAALGAILHAQVIRAIPYHLERLDPSLDSIISADSPLEILGEHFGLTEGPVWVKDSGGGYLCCSATAREPIT